MIFHMSENNGRTNVHVMVLHLTIADLIVSYVVIPLEIGWRLSVQWYAGDVACKLLVRPFCICSILFNIL